ncbi:hypothetical protein MERGE_000295 [Pneumocystis wakefieldiae]|uniref:Lysosomal cobalamin transporter n=1 Tax=Pneumocystis wakefieldiae TaxID=38082 RepID=A0A899FJB5_9ASCO|nr:hypothetical protein MERGE_000295 [Pneumocystis wakefieldiae]
MEEKDHSSAWVLYVSIILAFFWGLFRWIYQCQNKDKKSMIMIGIIAIIVLHMMGTLALYPIDIGMAWLRERNIEKEALFFSRTFMNITEEKNSDPYLKHFQQTFKYEYIKTSIFFIVDVVLLFGIILFCLYTALGFSLFPLRVIKINSINVPASITDIKHALILNREKQRAIEVRYAGFHAQMNVKDHRALESLQREERTLVRCIRLAEEGKRKWVQPISAILHLFQLLVGIFFLVISIGITLLMSMTIISKLENTYIRALYNYISKKWSFYCINTLSQYLFKTFPINLIIITLFILYFFVTTIIAIFNTKMTKKFRLFKCNIYKKRKNGTLPHTFLISLAILMLTIIIPKYYIHQIDQSHYNYTIFNYQETYRNPLKFISLPFKTQDYPSDRLYTSTVLNTIINDIMSNYQFFKTWYSYSYLLFLAVFFLSFIILSFSGKTENIQNNAEIEAERETFFFI